MDPKRRKAKLDRRNAGKNIDYDATPSSSPSLSSASSLNNYESASQFTQSLDFSDKMSFRVEGIAGEFDRICRSLGLSGPEDFAIPVAAWEARKQQSASDLLPRTSFNRLDSISSNPHLQDEEEIVIDLPDRVVDSVIRGGGGRIKGDRPPVLAPPPAMMRTVIEDNSSSTWDLFRAFGPDDGDETAVSMVAQLSRFSDSEQEDDDEAVVKREEVSEMWSEENAGPSESCSFTTSNNDDDSSSTATEPPSSISPNVRSKPVIRDWDKGELLGRGSFGSVYEGITGDGFFFAIKEVSLIDQGSQAKQSLFQLEQEIDLLSRFEHENIVRYYGAEKDEKNLYIFLELVTKGSLQSLYQKYNLRDTTVSAYTRQILLGLKYLHDQGVVHRDIKCANILVDANGSVKLADFGLAKAAKLNDVKSCKGTAFWMAPEVVNRKNHGYGLPADIWSLGCTVLEMITRLIPYSHLECMQALFRIGRGEPPPVSDDLPADARDFILQCLQVNPNDRPPASQLLDHPFIKRPMSTSSGSASPFHFGRRI